ncbi:hypothetical protein ACJRO7_023740 [Eucalyptus globulus]|uniref:Uncharacterized protein n=1 Tax=Eucalyptus globulus TaxID=34317 RepID=A0ABD3K578_EUCGL
MSAVSSPLASVRNPRAQLSSSFVHPLFRHRHLTSFLDLNQMIYKLLFATSQTGMLQLRSSRQLTQDGGRPSSASIFVDGFVLGGIIVGAPGCVYAPQILFELLNIRFSVFFPKFFSDNFSQAVHEPIHLSQSTLIILTTGGSFKPTTQVKNHYQTAQSSDTSSSALKCKQTYKTYTSSEPASSHLIQTTKASRRISRYSIRESHIDDADGIGTSSNFTAKAITS